MPRVDLPKIQDTGDDFIDSWQLRTEFGPTTNHRRRISRPDTKARHKIEIKRWKRVKELDRSGFGSVWLEQEEHDSSLRTVRQVSKSRYKLKLVEYLKEVLAIAKFVEDEGLFVRLLGWYQSPEAVYIATEYVPKETLQHSVTKPLPEDEAQIIALQIAEALCVMHEKNVAHRDLNPATVFVFDCPRQASALHVTNPPDSYTGSSPNKTHNSTNDQSQPSKFQNDIPSTKPVSGKTNNTKQGVKLEQATDDEKIPVNTLLSFEHKLGITNSTWWVKLGDCGVSECACKEITSPHLSVGSDFTAPETIGFIEHGEGAASKHTTAVDMWSFGCLIHWLLTGRVPLARWRLNLYCRNMLAFPTQHLHDNNVSEAGIDFIQKLLVSQPHDRLTASNALQHSWLHEISQDNDASTSSLPERDCASSFQGPIGSLPNHDKQTFDLDTSEVQKDGRSYSTTSPGHVKSNESRSFKHQNMLGARLDIPKSDSSNDDSNESDVFTDGWNTPKRSRDLKSQEALNESGNVFRANRVGSKTYIIDTHQDESSVFTGDAPRFLFGRDSSSEKLNEPSNVSTQARAGSGRSRPDSRSYRRHSTGSATTASSLRPSTPPQPSKNKHVPSHFAMGQERSATHETLCQLEIEFDNTWKPACTTFRHEPPLEHDKFEKEHIRLVEGFDQFILKLDGIQMGSQDDYCRSWKKKMIKNAQKQLKKLEKFAS